MMFYSDGAGRSGVYIAIDANIELCEEDGVFDVYGYLKKMRGLRRGLVETQVRLEFCKHFLVDTNHSVEQFYFPKPKSNQSQTCNF